MMRTAAIRRPCTFGKAAGIHEFNARVFMSLVIKPLRNITASEPLTKRRPREERSMTPAPPSRTAAYSVNEIGWFTLVSLLDVSPVGLVTASGGSTAPSPFGRAIIYL